MKAVSFSLYGTSLLYARGLLENLRRLPLVYPGWHALIYTDGVLGENWLSKYRILNATVHLRPARPDSGGMLWRFEPITEAAYDVVIVRDADSVVSQREAVAVNDWLTEAAPLHVIHDSQHHWNCPLPIQGGMWGAKRDALPYDFPHLVRWWLKHRGPFRRGDDMWFLERFVWPFVARNGLIHTSNVHSRYRGRPFPPHSRQQMHVGERISFNILDTPNDNWAGVLPKLKLNSGFAA